jgi:AcrR family transcriptional regulator
LRTIAERAGIGLPLLIYHFGNKEKLFDHIFAGRAELLSSERNRLLDELLADGRRPTPYELLEAYVRPWFQYAHRGNLHLLAKVVAESDPAQAASLYKTLDQTLARYIQALRQAAPNASDADVHWTMHILVGAALYVFNQTDRIKALSGDACVTAEDSLLTQQILSVVGARLTDCR